MCRSGPRRYLEYSHLGGDTCTARLSSTLRRALWLLPWLAATPMRIDGAHVELSYAGATRQFEIAPSVLNWGDSRLQFTGSIVHAAQGADGPGWHFNVKSTEGWLAAEPPYLQKLPIDQIAVRGFLEPDHGRIVLSQFLLKAGGGEVSAQGDVSDVSGALKGQLDAKIGSMPVATFKMLWPKLGCARYARLGDAKVGARQICWPAISRSFTAPTRTNLRVTQPRVPGAAQLGHSILNVATGIEPILASS